MPLIKISRLRLKNFKSFRKANIPFHSGFTAIAGSNASGKSNLLDAMLFVFGITSLKMLRASKLTDLVNHDASEPYAKVEMELHDGDKTYNIARKIDKEGRSVFKLDGKKRGLNEVTALLLELGIKATGSNIVVQGDVTRIIEMSPKERRKIIDDVAGLSEFEGKKEEALKKLEAVDRKVKDATIVLNEREQYLAELEKERESVVKYNSLKKELKRSKATMLNAEITRIRAELSGAEKKRGAMEKELENARMEKAQLGEESTGLEKRLDELIKKILSANERTYEEIGRKAEEMRSDVRLVRERISARENEIAEAGRRAELLKDRRGGLVSIIREKEKALQDAGDKLRGVKTRLGELNKIITRKSAKASAGGNKAADDERALEEARAKMAGAKDELYKLRSAEEKARHALMHAGARAEEIEDEKAELLAEVKAARLGMKRLAELRALNPEKGLKENAEAFEKTGDELHNLKNRHRITEEEISELGKAGKECPLCDTELNDKIKAAIMKRKAVLVAELKGKAEAKAAVREGLVKERAGLEGMLGEMRSLGAEEDSVRRAEEKIDALEKIIGGLNIAEIKRELKETAFARAGAEKELVEIERHAQGLKGKVDEFRNSAENIEIGNLIERLEGVNNENAETQNKIAKLEAELEATVRNRQETEAELGKLDEKRAENSKALEAQKTEFKEKEGALSKKDAELDKARKETKLFEEEKERLATRIENLEGKRNSASVKAEALSNQINEFNLAQSKNEVRIVDLELEFEHYKDEKALKEFNVAALRQRIPVIEREIEALGAINMKAVENFDAYKKEVDDIRGKTEKLESERKAVVEMIDKIDVKKNFVFMDCFEKIDHKFRDLYYMFFEGEGKLGLTDEVNPLDGGLAIQAKYKGEKLKSIDAMSGGEKSMTALAFLFAIQSFEPAPFYIFDEVDAALDKDNSLKLGRMVRAMSGKSQFISITHNDTMIAEANQLVGVSLSKQKSSVVGLRLSQKNAGAIMEIAKKENGAVEDTDE